MFEQTYAPPPPYAPPAIVGSPEQEQIWKAIREDTGHIIVKALAGTGKSYTCRQAMNQTNRALKVLYLAFNKVIADDFGRGAPTHCEVRTINSIGFRICKSNIRCEIDGYRLDRVIEGLWPQATSQRDVAAVLGRLVSLCKANLMDGRDTEALLTLATRQEIEIDDLTQDALWVVPEAIEYCKLNTAVIDFDDQVWLPVALNMTCPKFDLIFVDEAQDLNPLQHAFVMKLLRPGTGRMVVVGDEHQAIYGWRGADVESINNLATLLAATGLPTVTLPLTMTRRCPNLVVKKANEYVPALRAMPDAPDGVVESIKDEKALDAYAPGDMVVCRTNAPLLGVAFRLIRKEIKAVVRGRDIGQGLQTLIKHLRAADIDTLLHKLDDWEAREIRKVERTRRAETAIQRITDRADCVRALCEGCDSVEGLRGRIDSVFANFDAGGEPKNAVVLSSIHRAKGLEATNVFWLYPDIRCMASQEWQKTQETNLRYVAVTRAKHRLVMVTR